MIITGIPIPALHRTHGPADRDDDDRHGGGKPTTPGARSRFGISYSLRHDGWFFLIWL